MFRQLSISVVAVLLFLLPAQLMAGGAPRLCLPINNVAAENAEQCSKRLTDFFGKRVSGVVLREHKGQWYATISLRQDVSLAAVHEALAGSSFSVPRERLTLIGPAILSITVRTKFLEEFFSDLAKIEGLKVDESSRDGSGLLVTINQTNLCRNLDDGAGKARPSYDAVKKLLNDHNAELADVRWSGSWHCSGVFGCLFTPATATEGKVANR